MTAKERLAEKIKESYPGIVKKDVLCLKEMDPEMLADKTASRLRALDRYLPLANVACSLGKLVLTGKEDHRDTVRNINVRRFRVGFHLLDVMAYCGWIEFRRGGYDKKLKKYIIRSRDKWIVYEKDSEFISELLSDRQPEKLYKDIFCYPSLNKPSPFEDFYHDDAGELVRNVNPSVIPYFNPVVCPKVFQTINKHSSIQYKINLDLLRIYDHCQNDEIFTLRSKNLTRQQRKSITSGFDEVLNTAWNIYDKPFWEYMFFDYRGRIYASPAFLNHGGMKLAKSLFRFNKETPIGVEGWNWLLLQAANCFGYDKKPLDERITLAEGHLDEWMIWAKNPTKHKECRME